MQKIKSILSESIETKQAMLDDPQLLDTLLNVVKELVAAFGNGNKVLFCGNGGSAADAQHLAAELSGRFFLDRKPLFAEALHVNSSFITAVANDYGFTEIFARAVTAMGRDGDILFAMSTSGNSANVLKAIEAARDANMTVVGMTGKSGGQMEGICDYLIKIPSENTPRIQEGHLLAGHIVCELTEGIIFGKNDPQ